MDVTFTSTVLQVCGINVQTRLDLIYEHNEVFSVNLSVDTSANPRVRLGTNIIIRITDRQSKLEITDFFIYCSCFYRSCNIASEPNYSAK